MSYKNLIIVPKSGNVQKCPEKCPKSMLTNIFNIFWISKHYGLKSLFQNLFSKAPHGF